ncbi:DUF975 family protein [Niallia sp. 01092]|uniref:DUF975 family protein n=1 Tax=unclassified Niallia TaxID=2837522 RepID=UPI003FCF43AC
MSISELKRTARASLSGNWGKGVLLTVIVFLINAILPSIVEAPLSGGFSNWILQKDIPIGASIASTVISIILIPLGIAYTWFYLRIMREDFAQIADVFIVYKDVKTSLKLIWASIVQGIFLFLWFLLFIIPGIIKSFAYSQTFFLLKDHPEYTVTQAITESRKRMKGYKWKYFLLNLSFIGWAILCLITIGIGFLWLAPYISASLAAFYDEVIADKENLDSELI